MNPPSDKPTEEERPIPGGKYLLVDAAGPLVQAGLWSDGCWGEWLGSRDEAGRGLFSCVEEIFTGQRLSVRDLSGFLFCEGPGSMLGIRMAAMAIRGWQSLLDSPLPVFTYGSHDVLARVLLARPVEPPFHVISDARRSRWNVTSVDAEKKIVPLRRLSEEETQALEGQRYRMEEVVRAEPPGGTTEMTPYNLEKQAELFLAPELLRKGSAAEPVSQAGPEYTKWSAERHR